MLDDSDNKPTNPLIFQNLLREHLLTKEDIQKLRERLTIIYQSKESLTACLLASITNPLLHLNPNQITQEFFEKAKQRSFDELNQYEKKFHG